MAQHRPTAFKITAAVAVAAGMLMTAACGSSTGSTAGHSSSSDTSTATASAGAPFTPGAVPAWNMENRETPWTVQKDAIPAAVTSKFDPGVPQKAFDAVVALVEQFQYVSAYAGVDPLPQAVFDQIHAHLTPQAQKWFDPAAAAVAKPGVPASKADIDNVRLFLFSATFDDGSQYRPVNGYVYGHRTIRDARMSLDKYGQMKVSYDATADIYYQCQGRPYVSTVTTKATMWPVKGTTPEIPWQINGATGTWAWHADPKFHGAVADGCTKTHDEHQSPGASTSP